MGMRFGAMMRHNILNRFGFILYVLTLGHGGNNSFSVNGNSLPILGEKKQRPTVEVNRHQTYGN